MNIAAIVLTALSVILPIVMCIGLIKDVDNVHVLVINALTILIATIILGFIWNIPYMVAIPELVASVVAIVLSINTVINNL